MPTPRTITFFSAALVLYLFANQTQVGWLYVMSALLVGTVLAAGWLSRRALRGITGKRSLTPIELHEGDTAQVVLTLSKPKYGGTSQVRLVERCIVAAPDSPQRAMNIFIPSLSADSAVQLEYEVVVDRRGLHEFPPIEMTTRAPFGFFKHQQKLPLPTRVLVYPEVRPLAQLDLLDRQTAPVFTRQRAGLGYEVMGVRPFRTGDSARHIHWRSVARTNQLISKEFADEAQPGLTLVLDLYQHNYPTTDNKHTPFEWAVKAAASIGDYAQRKGYPLNILADEQALAIPSGPVSWSALLQYLARVQPTSRRALNQLNYSTTQAFVAAFLPWPDPAALTPLIELRHQRTEVLVVILDPASFPAGGPSGDVLAGQALAAGLQVRRLHFGSEWAAQLTEEPEAAKG